MKQVTFIGLGEIGGAIAKAIKENAVIRAFDKDPLKIPEGNSKTLPEAVAGAEVIFLCVPSWVIREVTEQISPLISPECIVISLAKGLEENTLKTMSEVLEEVLPKNQPSGVLGGPLLAEEIQKGLPSIAALGSKQDVSRKAMKELLKGSNIRLEYFEDAKTVALASVLKNIYAVALGVAEGLGWGWNGKGWLASKAMQEMLGISMAIGGDSEILLSSAGTGDFLATSMSPDSRNRQTGLEIARTGSCLKMSEGCRAITSIATLLDHKTDAFPVLNTLDRIINQHGDPKKEFQNMLTTAE